MRLRLYKIFKIQSSLELCAWWNCNISNRLSRCLNPQNLRKWIKIGIFFIHIKMNVQLNCVLKKCWPQPSVSVSAGLGPWGLAQYSDHCLNATRTDTGRTLCGDRDWSVGTSGQEHQVFEACSRRSLYEERKDSTVSEQGPAHITLPMLSFRTVIPHLLLPRFLPWALGNEILLNL